VLAGAAQGDDKDDASAHRTTEVVELAEASIGDQFLGVLVTEGFAFAKEVYSDTDTGTVTTVTDKDGQEVSYSAMVSYKGEEQFVATIAGPADPPQANAGGS